jgi:hypothetical protein
MTEIERTRATIARLQQKLASAEGASARYYELCIIGERVAAEAGVGRSVTSYLAMRGRLAA